MMTWLRWSVLRAPLLPVAWVLAHATVLLWKALDPRYIDGAQWITDYILKPLHPLGVWLISAVAPQLRTLIANMPPTHQDVDKVLYGFLVPVYMGIIIGLFSFVRLLVFGHSTRARTERLT